MLLFSYLKTNKTSTDNTINKHSKSLMYIFVMECTTFHLQGGQKSKPHIFVYFFAKILTIFNFFQRHIPWKICIKVFTKYTTTP